ncbi:MAG: DNA-processing protein DprA [Bacillus sp. (in: firmicutes)]
MDELTKRLLLLQHCRGIGWKGIYRILQDDVTLNNLFANNLYDWLTYLPQSPHSKTSLFYHDLHSIDIHEKVQQYQRNNIQITTIFDEDYPERLKHLCNPPWIIYMKGNVQLLHEQKILAVVGTRKPSAYGQEALRKIVPGLIEKGYTIVSGLAMGIDACAHKETIHHRGKTIAVLGGGLFNIYPKENTSLALHMMEEQLVLSEIPPFRKPEPWMFPLRNRIISGISDGTFVVEAKERSGSLITAYQALEQGKEVFSLPGNVTSLQSVGTNRLLQEGAKLVQTYQDITDEFESLFVE